MFGLCKIRFFTQDLQTAILAYQEKVSCRRGRYVLVTALPSDYVKCTLT